MQTEQISIGPVRLIIGKNGAKFPFCNSLFVEAAGLIIDPSSNRAILETLYDAGKIKTVCLTHWHEDHFRYFYLLENCQYWISESDSVPLSSSQAFIKWYGIDSPEGKDLRKMIQAKMASEIRFKDRIPDRLLTDGQVIDLGSVSMEVIASPGHSPGHLSFFFREPAILFLGDYNLDEFGPWTGDPNSDIDQCIATIKRLSKIPAEMLIAGHRVRPIETGAERLWEQYLETIAQREGKILKYLTEPRTMDEILDQWIILEKPKEPINYFRLGEKAHIEKHLRRLLKTGAIIHEDGRYHSSG